MRCGGERVVVRLAADRGRRADDTDPAVAGGGYRAARGRLDHLDDRDRVPLARVAQARRTCGVAGDHEQLYLVVLDEAVHDLERKRANVGDPPRAVRAVGRVPDVDDRLRRELVENCPRNREPADAAVEDPERRVHAPKCSRNPWFTWHV